MTANLGTSVLHWRLPGFPNSYAQHRFLLHEERVVVDYAFVRNWHPGGPSEREKTDVDWAHRLGDLLPIMLTTIHKLANRVVKNMGTHENEVREWESRMNERDATM